MKRGKDQRANEHRTANIHSRHGVNEFKTDDGALRVCHRGCIKYEFEDIFENSYPHSYGIFPDFLKT